MNFMCQHWRVHETIIMSTMISHEVSSSPLTSCIKTRGLIIRDSPNSLRPWIAGFGSNFRNRNPFKIKCPGQHVAWRMLFYLLFIHVECNLHVGANEAPDVNGAPLLHTAVIYGYLNRSFSAFLFVLGCRIIIDISQSNIVQWALKRLVAALSQMPFSAFILNTNFGFPLRIELYNHYRHLSIQYSGV